MTATENVTEIKPVEDKPEKTMTWRVLRRDPDTIESVTRWIEEAQISGSGKFGYYPTAEDIGAKYGEGDFILIVVTDGYKWVELKTVVADRYYREADPDV